MKLPSVTSTTQVPLLLALCLVAVSHAVVALDGVHLPEPAGVPHSDPDLGATGVRVAVPDTVMVFVNPSIGVDAPDCGAEGSPCETAQYAVAYVAPPYSTVRLSPGRHECGLHITRPLALVGEGSAIATAAAAEAGGTVGGRPPSTMFDCHSKQRAVWFDEVPVHVDGIHFRNGYGAGGGCVLGTQRYGSALETNSILRCSFHRCTAVSSTRHPSVGGAVAIIQAHSTPRPYEVSKSNFHSNYARGGSHAVGGVAVVYRSPPADDRFSVDHSPVLDTDEPVYNANVAGCEAYALETPVGLTTLSADDATKLSLFAGLYTRVPGSETLFGGNTLIHAYNNLGGRMPGLVNEVPETARWLIFCKSELQWALIITVGPMVDPREQSFACSGEFHSTMMRMSPTQVAVEFHAQWLWGNAVLDVPLVFQCLRKGFSNGIRESPKDAIVRTTSVTTPAASTAAAHGQCSAVVVSNVPLTQQLREGVYVELQNYTRHGRPVFWNVDSEHGSDSQQWLWYCGSAGEWVFGDTNPHTIPLTPDGEVCHRGIASATTLAGHPAHVTQWKYWDGQAGDGEGSNGQWRNSPASRFNGITVSCAVPPPRPSVPMPGEHCPVLQMHASPLPSEAPAGPYALIPGLSHNQRPVYRSTSSANARPYHVWYCGSFSEFVIAQESPWGGDDEARPVTPPADFSASIASRAPLGPPFGPTSDELLRLGMPPNDLCIRSLSSHRTHQQRPDTGGLSWAYIFGDEWMPASAATGLKCVAHCPEFTFYHPQLPRVNGVFVASGTAFDFPLYRRVGGGALFMRAGRCAPWLLFPFSTPDQAPWDSRLLQKAIVAQRSLNFAEYAPDSMNHSTGEPHARLWTCSSSAPWDEPDNLLAPVIASAVLHSDYNVFASPTSASSDDDPTARRRQYHQMAPQMAGHPLGVLHWKLGGIGKKKLVAEPPVSTPIPKSGPRASKAMQDAKAGTSGTTTRTHRQPALLCSAYQRCDSLNITQLPSSLPGILEGIDPNMLFQFVQTNTVVAGRPTFWGAADVNADHPLVIYYCAPGQRWVISPSLPSPEALRSGRHGRDDDEPGLDGSDEADADAAAGFGASSALCPAFVASRTTAAKIPLSANGVLWDRLVPRAATGPNRELQPGDAASEKSGKFRVAAAPMLVHCDEGFKGTALDLRNKNRRLTDPAATKKESGSRQPLTSKSAGFDPVVLISESNFTDNVAASDAGLAMNPATAGAVMLSLAVAPTGDDHHGIFKKLQFAQNEAVLSTLGAFQVRAGDDVTPSLDKPLSEDADTRRLAQLLSHWRQGGAGGLGILNYERLPLYFQRSRRHTHTLVDVTAVHNEGPSGGIMLRGVTALLHRVTLKRNVALRDGGGLDARDSNVTFSGGTCSFNHAHGCGGCARFDEVSKMHVSKSTLSNNSAHRDGTTIASYGVVHISESQVDRMMSLAIAGSYVLLTASELSCLRGGATSHINGFGCIFDGHADTGAPLEVPMPPIATETTEDFVAWLAQQASFVAQCMLSLTMAIFGYQHFFTKPPPSRRLPPKR